MIRNLINALFALAVLAGCSEEPSALPPLPERQHYAGFAEVDSTEANLVAEVSDGGLFNLTGSIEIIEIDDSRTPFMTLAFNGLGRGNRDERVSFDLGVSLGSDGQFFRALQAGVQSKQAPASWLSYSNGDDAISRPITEMRLELLSLQGVRIELSLGSAVNYDTGEPIDRVESSFVVISGRISVSCRPNRHVTNPPPLPPGVNLGLTPVQDPLFATQFCRDALHELGLSDFLEYPPSGPAVAHPTDLNAPPTTVRDPETGVVGTQESSIRL